MQILLPLTCIGTDVHSTSTGASGISVSSKQLVLLARDRLHERALQPRILGLLLQRLEPSPSKFYARCLVDFLKAVLLESAGNADENDSKSLVDNDRSYEPSVKENVEAPLREELTQFIKGCRFPMHALLHCSHRLREEAAKRDLQNPSLRAHNPLTLNADKMEDEAVRLLECCVSEGESECLLSEQASLDPERGPQSSCFHLAVRLAMRKVVAHQHFQVQVPFSN